MRQSPSSFRIEPELMGKLAAEPRALFMALRALRDEVEVHGVPVRGDDAAQLQRRVASYAEGCELRIAGLIAQGRARDLPTLERLCWLAGSMQELPELAARALGPQALGGPSGKLAEELDLLERALTQRLALQAEVLGNISHAAAAAALPSA